MTSEPTSVQATNISFLPAVDLHPVLIKAVHGIDGQHASRAVVRRFIDRERRIRHRGWVGGIGCPGAAPPDRRKMRQDRAVAVPLKERLGRRLCDPQRTRETRQKIYEAAVLEKDYYDRFDRLELLRQRPFVGRGRGGNCYRSQKGNECASHEKPRSVFDLLPV